jgi:hypothetical protein
MNEKPESEKLSHRLVNYEERSTHLPNRCGTCKHFIPPDRCQGVKKPIAPPGWCARFDRK